MSQSFVHAAAVVGTYRFPATSSSPLLLLWSSVLPRIKRESATDEVLSKKSGVKATASNRKILKEWFEDI